MCAYVNTWLWDAVHVRVKDYTQTLCRGTLTVEQPLQHGSIATEKTMTDKLMNHADRLINSFRSL